MQTYRPPFKSFFLKFIITSKRADRNSLFAFKRHKWHKKSSYLVFPAHHRKPHVAAACYPDQFTLRTSTAEDTHTRTNCTHLFFPFLSFLPSFFLFFFLNPRERINLLTWTDKSKTSQQLHRLSVIHWAELLKITVYGQKCGIKKFLYVKQRRAGIFPLFILKGLTGKKNKS